MGSDVFFEERFLLICRRMFSIDFFLEFHQAFDECFWAWRAAGNINVHGDDLVDALENRVGAIHAAGRCAGTHGDTPFWLRHLVPDTFHGESHFVSDGSGDDHDVGLARGETHDFHAEAGDVEAGRGGGHEFDRAAGKAHRHRPKRVFPHPVNRGIDAREDDVALDFRIVGGVDWDGGSAFHNGVTSRERWWLVADVSSGL